MALVGISLALMMVSSSGPAVELQNGVRFAFRPIQAGLDSVARGVSDIVETVTQIETLHRSNDQLSRDNARLAAENARTRELERQNGILTELLEVKGSLSFATVTGSIIGRESSQFRRVVTIDVGSDSGVRAGDVVVGPGGALVGRVTSVTGNSATVLLVNDAGSTVIGQLGKNQATGSVIGQLGGVLIMENIDTTERLQIGDTVTTAGIDLGGGVRSPFPKGLVIGSLVDVEHDANAVTQTAFIQPAADLDRLEYVLVITDYQGGLPPVDGSPSPCPSGAAAAKSGQPCASPTPSP